MSSLGLSPQMLSLPPATKALTGTLIALSTFLFLLKLTAEPASADGISTSLLASGGRDASVAYPWLVVVPGQVGWYFWTLLSAGFVETTFIEVRLYMSFDEELLLQSWEGRHRDPLPLPSPDSVVDKRKRRPRVPR